MADGDSPSLPESEEGVACKARSARLAGVVREQGTAWDGGELTKEVLVAVTQLEPKLPVPQHVLDQEDPVRIRTVLAWTLACVGRSISAGRKGVRIKVVGLAQQDLARFDGELVAALDAQDGPDGLCGARGQLRWLGLG